MGGSAAGVPRASLIDRPIDTWTKEIRDYLLGRLSVGALPVPLKSAQQARLDHPPIRRWWTFEGKRYATLGGPLAEHWPTVLHAARRLKEPSTQRYVCPTVRTAWWTGLRLLLEAH